MEFVLLQACFSLPKVSYALRTTLASASCLDHWVNFDSHVRDTLGRILGSNLTDTAWAQAQLPVALTGMGLRSAARHAAASFLASQVQSESLVSQMLIVDFVQPSPSTTEALSHLSNQLQLVATDSGNGGGGGSVTEGAELEAGQDEP